MEYSYTPLFKPRPLLRRLERSAGRKPILTALKLRKMYWTVARQPMA
jgi:hypothetical protein